MDRKIECLWLRKLKIEKFSLQTSARHTHPDSFVVCITGHRLFRSHVYIQATWTAINKTYVQRSYKDGVYKENNVYFNQTLQYHGLPTSRSLILASILGFFRCMPLAQHLFPKALEAAASCCSGLTAPMNGPFDELLCEGLSLLEDFSGVYISDLLG